LLTQYYDNQLIMNKLVTIACSLLLAK
jgi:hypothetical protein